MQRIEPRRRSGTSCLELRVLATREEGRGKLQDEKVAGPERQSSCCEV